MHLFLQIIPFCCKSNPKQSIKQTLYVMQFLCIATSKQIRKKKEKTFWFQIKFWFGYSIQSAIEVVSDFQEKLLFYNVGNSLLFMHFLSFTSILHYEVFESTWAKKKKKQKS